MGEKLPGVEDVGKEGLYITCEYTGEYVDVEFEGADSICDVNSY